MNKNTNIKGWYKSTFPTDELGDEIFKYKVIWSTINKYRQDQFTFDTYFKAKSRMEKLQKIFRAPQWKWEIVVFE